MADSKKVPAVDGFRAQPYDGFNSDERPVDTDNGSTVDAQNFAFTEDRKIGVTGAVFLILNKMIGTGSKLRYLQNTRTKLIISLLHAIGYFRSYRIRRRLSHVMDHRWLLDLLRS